MEGATGLVGSRDATGTMFPAAAKVVAHAREAAERNRAEAQRLKEAEKALTSHKAVGVYAGEMVDALTRCAQHVQASSEHDAWETKSHWFVSCKRDAGLSANVHVYGDTAPGPVVDELIRVGTAMGLALQLSYDSKWAYVGSDFRTGTPVSRGLVQSSRTVFP